MNIYIYICTRGDSLCDLGSLFKLEVTKKGSRKLTIPKRVQKIARYIHWGIPGPLTVAFVKVYFGALHKNEQIIISLLVGRG